MDGVIGMAAAGIAVGTASGADNFRAAAGFALVDRRAAFRWMSALIVADGVALALGAVLGSLLPDAVSDVAPTIGFVALAVLAGAAILGADELVERIVESRSLTVGIPILLSLDSLVAGTAVGALGYPLQWVLPIAVATSALLCLIGYAAGSTLRSHPLGVSPVRLGGVVMAIAIVIAIRNG
jgi:putative Mn2+ efflux pump MntP